jgi:conjugative transfer signal peptidase TraF
MNRRPTGGEQAPLFAWGDALRAAKSRRKRLIQRTAAVAAGAATLLGTAVFPPAPRLVWNASASAPIGFYAVSPGALAEPGDMVIARVPEAWRRLAATRHYLPINVPLVKRVAAAAGDEVCAVRHEIFVNGGAVAHRRAADGARRTMPAWHGCVRLRDRQLFLLMDAEGSFDGRYFGVTDGSDVVGKAVPLWVR